MTKAKGKGGGGGKRPNVPPLLPASLFATAASSSSKKKKGGANMAAQGLLNYTAAANSGAANTAQMAQMAVSIAAAAQAANITDPQVIMAMTQAAMITSSASPFAGVSPAVGGFPGFGYQLYSPQPVAAAQQPTTSGTKAKAAAARRNSRRSTTDSQDGADSGAASGGLKLVLKRQSGNKYEVKQEDGSGVPSPAVSTASTSSSSLAATNSSGRPRREAARKVKFVNNEESDESPLRKKPTRMPPNPYSNDLDSDQYMEEVEGHHGHHQAHHKDARRPAVHHVKQEEAVITKPISAPLVAPPPEPFDSPADIIVPCSEHDQAHILTHQPFVRVARSKPFPIALVEDKTNVVCTKAFLLMHLFLTYSAPCINCPLCERFMSITEFSKHIHPSEDDDEEEEEEEPAEDENKAVEYLDGTGPKKTTKKVKKEKSYKILPYRIDNTEKLSESEVQTWKLFGKRYSQFKQQRAERLKQAKTQPLAQQQQPKAAKPPVAKFNEWDSTVAAKEASATLYMASQQRLSSDVVVTVTSEEEAKQQQETTAPKPAAAPPKLLPKAVDDLSLSEDEDEGQEVKKPAPAVIEHHDEDSVSSMSSTTTATSETAAAALETKAAVVVERRSSGPSLTERYVNLYDNMSMDLLLYICDNEFTIIPDSYILYLNKKREKNLRNVKLAHTQQHLKQWLTLSLDLECNNRHLYLQQKMKRSASKNADKNNNVTNNQNMHEIPVV